MSEMLKLNLGCGFNQLQTYINVDKFPGCNPDQVIDLEKTPWPWPDNSASEICMNHVLEHLGQNPEVFLSIVKEVYRVLAPDGVWNIRVPHPRHDEFLADPTHVRAITRSTMEMFDLKKNQESIKVKFQTSPLAIMIGVDFELVSDKITADDVWQGRLQRGEVNEADLNHLLWHSNNIAREISMVLRARKS